MRILKGYNKTEQKELKEFKKVLDINDLLNIITGVAPNRICGLIWEKYVKANTDKRISIIRDILDFYADKATFAEPKKYYVHLVKSDWYSYLNINTDGGLQLYNRLELNGLKTKFTREEVVAINPNLVPFMEEVEDNE